MKKSWILSILMIWVIISSCATETPLLRGEDAYYKGEYSKAISYLKTATELNPRDGYSFSYLCSAYYENGQYQEAIDACQKALNIPHGTAWEQSDRDCLEAAYNKLGQIDLAISSRKKVIELSPDSSRNFVVLGGYYYKNKQYDEAITADKRAIELKSDNDVAYYQVGVAYGMKKQYSEAMKALQAAIEINPQMSDAYHWMGNFLMEQNAYNEAAEEYKKGIKTSPSKPGLHNFLAVAYYRSGRYDDAIATIDKAIELQTILGSVGLNIGQNSFTNNYYVDIVENTGPAKKAGIQVGDKVLKINGKSTDDLNLEQVVQSLKNALGMQVTLTIERKGIDKPFEKLITREAIFDKRVAVSFALRSLFHRSKGNQEKSFKDAEKAYSLDSTNDWAQLSLGESYLDRGKYYDAIKLLAQVKDSPSARILEATTYAKQGKMKEAVNVYFSIPEEEISPKNIPLMNNRMVLLQLFEPLVKEHRDKANSFQENGKDREALFELSEAWKIADDIEAQAIDKVMFSMVRRNPSLSEMPEDARKHALRSEVLVKEGNFEPAAAELEKAIQIAPYEAQLYSNSAFVNAELKIYPEAIRRMKIYLMAAPDAPDARTAEDEIIKWEFMVEREKK